MAAVVSSRVRRDRVGALAALARSFGGRPGDRFIESRLDGYHRRVAKAIPDGVQIHPVRGFDAVVEVLIRRSDLVEADLADDDRARRKLAEVVAHGAAFSDLFIANLLDRLRRRPAGG